MFAWDRPVHAVACALAVIIAACALTSAPHVANHAGGSSRIVVGTPSVGTSPMPVVRLYDAAGSSSDHDSRYRRERPAHGPDCAEFTSGPILRAGGPVLVSVWSRVGGLCPVPSLRTWEGDPSAAALALRPIPVGLTIASVAVARR